MEEHSPAVLDSMVTTAFTLDGYAVERNIGIVRGIIVRSRSIFGTLGASLQTMVGGDITLFTNLCEETRAHAYQRMAEHAAQLGANAIVGVRYDATEIMQGVTEVLCYGTAVVVKPARSVNENRYLCIHGHFYQPPRENPWLEAIELQDSASPYHDWNERITAECYAPNSAARILDAGRPHRKNRQQLLAASASTSAPRLLSWMKDKAPETYQKILDADRVSAQRFSGHGSALAQCYNHMIMPLANARDKLTQVIWGIEDFRFRFGRDPEGMWLPETAVDLETLDRMAQHGIQFTILAPSQAKSMDGIDVTGQRIDPARAYRQKLPSGRSINLFFYDGPVSQAVAFERLLDDGGRFAQRLLDALSDQREGPQLAHIATDGETYGHHHAFGDMALAYALDHIESSGLAKVTNYGEFLERHPAEHDVEILENTAWSCVHGVGRWNSQLRLQLRRPRRVESGMARSAARSAGLAAGRDRALL